MNLKRFTSVFLSLFAYFALSFYGVSESFAATLYKPGQTINYGWTEDKVFMANYESNLTVAITYDANGGTGNAPMSPVSCTAGLECKAPAGTYSRPGYTFSGWECVSIKDNSSCGKFNLGQSLASVVTESHKDGIILKAAWIAHSFNVAYANGGGTGSAPTAPTSCTYGGTCKAPANTYTRAGYEFNGWSCTSSSGSCASDWYAANADLSKATTVDGATITLTATWKTGADSTITLDADGGVIMSGSSVTSGSTCTVESDDIVLPTPTKTGYTFAGWYNAAGEQVATIAKGECTSDMSFTAHWTPITYKVKFDKNKPENATGTPLLGGLTTKTYTYGEEGTLPETVRANLTGWEFKGFNTKADGTGTAYELGAKVLNWASEQDAVVTLYAQWEPDVRELDWYYMRGSDETVSGMPETCLYDSVFTLPQGPSRVGYTFAGWVNYNYNASITPDTVRYQAGEEFVCGVGPNFTATWTPIKFNVAYAADGGTGDAPTSPVECTYEGSCVAPVSPYTKPGYMFGGWKCTSSEGECAASVYNVGDNIATATAIEGATITLTVNWVPGEDSKIILDTDGGTINDASFVYACNVGYAVTLPTRVTKTGYRFDGWYNADGEYVDEIAKGECTSDMSFTADWSPITYYVEYNANGGSIQAGGAKQTFKYGVASELNGAAMINGNKQFLGWSTDKNATTAMYANNQSVLNLAATSGTTVILYAVWGDCPACAAGTGAECTLSAPLGVCTYTTSCKTGYNTLVNGGKYNPSCTPNTFKIVYDTGVGVTLPETVCTYDQDCFLAGIDTFSKPGHVFVGWAQTFYDEWYKPGANVKNVIESGSLDLGAIWNPCPACAGSNVSCEMSVVNNVCTYKTSCLDGYDKLTNNGSANASCSLTVRKVTYVDADLAAGTCDINNAMTLPTNATKTGYTFAGWLNAAGKPVTAIAKGECTSDMSFTAQWTANTYTVVYNANGGTGTMANGVHTYDAAKALTANAFTNGTKKFLGWSTDKNATTATYTNKQSVTNLVSTNGSTVTLYAVWGTCAACAAGTGAECTLSAPLGVCTYTTSCKTGYNTLVNDGKYNPSCTANKYTVVYNANGGTGTMASGTHTYDAAKALTANAFTNGIKQFLGWSTDKNATTATYTNKQSVTNLVSTNGSTVTLYAVWGTCTACAAGTGAECTLSAPLGVCTYTTSCKTGYNTLVNDGKYNPSCTANTFNVAYANGGGTGSAPTSPVTCTYGGTCKAPANTYTRGGYEFNGWSCKSGSGACAANKYAVGADLSKATTVNGATITLSATWKTGADSTITYNVDGGQINGLYDDTCNVETAVTLPTNVTKTGYTFAGWYNAAGKQVAEIALDECVSDMDFTARWTANTYTVVYNSNKPSQASASVAGTTTSSTHTYDAAKALTNNGYSLTGWDFAGWNTKADGMGVAYDNMATVKNLSADSAAKVTLYAQWTPKTLNLTWDNGGRGVAPAEPETCTYDSSFKMPAAMSATGYTFDKWTVNGKTFDANALVVCNVANLGVASGSVTIVGAWTVNKYTCAAGQYLDGTTCVTCAAGYYCPQSGTYTYNAGVQGRTICPSGYLSESGATYCYVTTTEGMYVARAGAGLTACKAGDYCPAGEVVSHTAVGGNKKCSALGSGYTSDEGAYADTMCYKSCALASNATEMTGRDYYGAGVDTCVPTSCELGYVLANGICANCPVNNVCDMNYDNGEPHTCSERTNGVYPFSGMNTISVNDCYMNTTVGNYVAVAGKGEVACKLGDYCPGDVKVKYSMVGGNTSCSTLGAEYSSDAGVSSVTQCYKRCPLSENATAMSGRDYYGTEATDTCEVTSCKAGYTLKNGKCELCPSNSVCSPDKDNGKPYTCSELTGGTHELSKPGAAKVEDCYKECEPFDIEYGKANPVAKTEFWPAQCRFEGISVTGNPCDIVDGVCVEKSCNHNYEMIAGFCTPCSRENAVSYKKTGGNCVVESCVNGFHPNGQSCEPNVIECSAKNAVSASRVWNSAKNAFGECVISECEDGYHLGANSCQLDEQTCVLENGVGTRVWNHKSKTWGECVATKCDPGYTDDRSMTNELWKQCGRCNNAYGAGGEIAVSSYARGCEIASCMYEGELYTLENNECRLICDTYSDETGSRRWNASRKKCEHTCTPGYMQW